MKSNIFQNRISFLVLIILISCFGTLTQYLAYSDFYQSKFNIGTIYSNIITRVLIGWAFFIIIQFVSIKFTLKFKWVWLGLALILAILTALFGYEIYGLKRFLNVGGYFFNIGYWILLFYIFFLASRKQENIEQLSKSNKLHIISIFSEVAITAVILSLLLLYMEKQIFLILLSVIILNLYLMNKKRLAIVTCAISLVLIAFYFISYSHLSDRIAGYYTHNGSCHQVQQCLNSFEYGGFLGIGFDKTSRSLSEGNLLPESLGHTTFAVVIEHFGIIGGLMIVTFFTYFVYYGLRIYKRNKENSEVFLTMLLLSAVIIFNLAHIMNCLNLFPFGSMLSFFSSGRDFNIISMITAGLIYKYGEKNTGNKLEII